MRPGDQRCSLCIDPNSALQSALKRPEMSTIRAGVLSFLRCFTTLMDSPRKAMMARYEKEANRGPASLDSKDRICNNADPGEECG